MSKKTKSRSVTVLKVIGTTLLALLIAGGSVAIAYGYNDDFKNWVDDIRNPGSSQSGDSEKDPAENITNEDGGLSIYLPQGRVFNAAPTLGTTSLSASATVKPDNATNKAINWISADPTKVSVQNAQTQSGDSNKLILQSYFTGTVAVTAVSDDNPDAKVIFTVSHRNFIQDVQCLALGGYGLDSDGSGLYTLKTLDSKFTINDPAINNHKGFYMHWDLGKVYCSVPATGSDAFLSGYIYPCMVFAVKGVVSGEPEFSSSDPVITSFSGTGAQSMVHAFRATGQLAELTVPTGYTAYSVYFRSNSSDSTVLNKGYQALPFGTVSLSYDVAAGEAFKSAGSVYIPVSNMSGGGTIEFE